MEQAWSDRRVGVVTVSAVVLAASAMVIVLGARPYPVRACGCAARPPCASMAPSGERPGSAPAPFSGGRTAWENHDPENVHPAQRHAIPIPVSGDGLALKVSFYRGLGGGMTSSLTRDGLAFTFESGAGVGGSFSAGSTMGRPNAGLSFEARASTSSRLHVVRAPDFGLTLSPDGMVQGYADAKTGNFRTRFRSKPMSLTEGGFRGRAQAPVTRRSWSLGTEFKLAATYTVRVPWGGLFQVWKDMFGTVPGDWGSRAPPRRPGDLVGHLSVPGRPAARNVVDLRRRGAGRRPGRADRYCGPRALRVRRAPGGGRRTRFARRRGTASWTRGARSGARAGSASGGPDDEDPG